MSHTRLFHRSRGKIISSKIRTRNELRVIEKLTSRLEETPVNVTSEESNFENNFAKWAFEKLSNYSQFFENRIGPVEDSFWKWQIREWEWPVGRKNSKLKAALSDRRVGASLQTTTMMIDTWCELCLSSFLYRCSYHAKERATILSKLSSDSQLLVVFCSIQVNEGWRRRYANSCSGFSNFFEYACRISLSYLCIPRLRNVYRTKACVASVWTIEEKLQGKVSRKFNKLWNFEDT